MKGFSPFLTSSGWFLGLGLFQNMFHNLIIYTNNFCFGWIAVSCFFETLPAGWVAGKSNFNENAVVSPHLDLNFEIWLRVCQKTLKTKMCYLQSVLDTDLYIASYIRNIIFP